MSRNGQPAFDFFDDPDVEKPIPASQQWSTIDRISSIAGVPIRPKNPPTDADWECFEGELGLKLPSDLKELVSAYGVGEWAGFLSTINPAWNISGVDGILEMASHYESRYPEYSWYPASGGLLLWGVTNTRTSLFWDTTSETPSEWPTVVSDLSKIEKIEKPATELIYEGLAGNLDVMTLPMLSGLRRFLAWDDERRRHYDVCN